MLPSWWRWVVRWPTGRGGAKVPFIGLRVCFLSLVGWFITAGAAFTICFLAALVIYLGGIAAMVGVVALAAYMLVRNQILYKKKLKKEAMQEEVDSTISKLRETTDKREALSLFPRTQPRRIV